MKTPIMLQLLLLLLTVEAQQPPAEVAAQQLQLTTANAWFDTADTNHDESLTRQEVVAGFDQLVQQAAAQTAGGSSSSTWRWPWSSSSASASATDNTAAAAAAKPDNFWKSFTSAVAMIVATELGDKTFFIAAVLSMKHDRSAVLAGAVTALFIMTVLSTAMGLVLPQLLSRRYTTYISILLFLYFGVKLLSEGAQMKAGHTSDELGEVEEELLLQSNKKADGDTNDDGNDENGQDEEKGVSKKTRRRTKKVKTAWYQVAIQALTLTFLAEWGDRSQVATIALAAYHDPVGVTIGGCLGHLMCTGLAVVGGRMLAARISEKTVALSGGVLFLVFGVHSMFYDT